MMIHKFIRFVSLFSFIGMSTFVYANEGLLLEITYQLEELHQNINQLQGQLDELRHDLEQVKSSQTTQYNDIDEKLSQITQQVDNNTLTVNELDKQVTSLSDINYQLQNMSNDTDTSFKIAEGIEPNKIAVDPLKAQETKQAQQLYEKAKQFALNGKYEDAKINFSQLAEQFPNSEYAGFAYYWLGQVELAAEQPNLAEAQKAFQTMIDNYPQNSRIPETLLRLSEVELALNHPKIASELLHQLVTEYPSNRYVADANKLSKEIQQMYNLNNKSTATQ